MYIYLIRGRSARAEGVRAAALLPYMPMTHFAVHENLPSLNQILQ